LLLTDLEDITGCFASHLESQRFMDRQHTAQAVCRSCGHYFLLILFPVFWRPKILA